MTTSEQEFIGRLIAFGRLDEDVDFYLNKLNEDDFTVPRFQQVFLAAKNLSKKSIPIDAWSLSQELKWDAFDMFSADLYYAPLATSARYLREETIRRQVKKLSQEIGEEKDVVAKLVQYQKGLQELEQEQIKTSSSDFLFQALDNRKSPLGFRTGFQSLDNNTKRLKKGHFWVVGAYTNTGKTRFALQMCDAAQKEKAKIAFISLEMNGDDLMEVYLSVKMNRGLSEEEAAGEIVMNTIEVPTTLHKLSDLEKYIFDHNFDIVFIDFLQLILTSDKVEYERVSNVALTLARIAQKKGVCIVALSQVSEDFKRHRNFNNLGYKGSGSIGSAADVGLILHRDFEKEMQETGNVVEFFVIIRKNRFGITGDFRLNFDRNTGKIF